MNNIESLHFIKGRQLNLTNLEELDLSYNLIEDNIFASLRTFPNLKSLCVSNNQLKGSIDMKDLGTLTNLEELDMSSNDLNQFVAQKEFKSLRKLKVLNLDEIFSNGSIPILLKLVEAFPSVKTFSLKGNYINNTMPTHELHMSSNVEQIILDYSFLNNNILQSIGVFTSLKILSLSSSGLKGSLPDQGWCDLRNLEELDMSRNALEGVLPDCLGQIPDELGNLSGIRSLNLSRNNLTGVIPSSFSRLKQIESLDLSYNNLSGTIPIQLVELNSLEVFSVAHNNLSGTIPKPDAQFGTFDKGSYEGNPLLCGPPLNNCSKPESSPPTTTSSDDKEEGSFMDRFFFCVSFLVSYAAVLLGIFVALYINPYWRQAWFSFIEGCITTCRYSIVGNFLELHILQRFA
ncbi:hypothetical protein PTKIN_Ptkin09bG0230800 [Pterospermum kingtungense]